MVEEKVPCAICHGSQAAIHEEGYFVCTSCYFEVWVCGNREMLKPGYYEKD